MARAAKLIPRTGHLFRYLPNMAGAKAPYRITCCVHDHIHVEIGDGKDGRGITELVFADPDAAYQFSQKLLRAYDIATGIVPPEGE